MAVYSIQEWTANLEESRTLLSYYLLTKDDE